MSCLWVISLDRNSLFVVVVNALSYPPVCYVATRLWHSALGGPGGRLWRRCTTDLQQMAPVRALVAIIEMGAPEEQVGKYASTLIQGSPGLHVRRDQSPWVT